MPETERANNTAAARTYHPEMRLEKAKRVHVQKRCDEWASHHRDSRPSPQQQQQQLFHQYLCRSLTSSSSSSSFP